MHRRTASLFTLTLSLSLLAFALAGSEAAQGQMYTVLYRFTGGDNGSQPSAGLTPAGPGTFYGTTLGYTDNQGTVFRLMQTSGNWALQTFASGLEFPAGRVVLGPHGYLYGMTSGGLDDCYFSHVNCGEVYSLRPACSSPNCPWKLSVLYQFQGGDDGGTPSWVEPVFDQAGNLYGSTEGGGTTGNGVIFKLTAPAGGGNGQWSEAPIYNFTDGNDGKWPLGRLIFDSAGNLYGTAQGGANQDGTVFELSPSGSGWAFQTLYTFQGGPDGKLPIGGLSSDGLGNLYGTTAEAGADEGGTVFKLSPSGSSWTFSVLYGLPEGAGPDATVTADAASNLYGTTQGGGTYGGGSVFKLTPMNGDWSYADLHDFKNFGGAPNLMGAVPEGAVAIDASGNIYGTTAEGGINNQNCFPGCGVIWEIAP